MTDQDNLDDALDNQDESEPVEIGPDGQIYTPGKAPKSTRKKPTVLRDPKGEYGDY